MIGTLGFDVLTEAQVGVLEKAVVLCF
jgi:hypothetical protein